MFVLTFTLKASSWALVEEKLRKMGWRRRVNEGRKWERMEERMPVMIPWREDASLCVGFWVFHTLKRCSHCNHLQNS